MLFLFAVFSAAVLSTPTITLPIANQYPPIAVLGRNYRFQFASTTFTASKEAPLTYKTKDAPPWLSLDIDTRTLSGTPVGSTARTETFELIASDGTGSTASQITIPVVHNLSIEAPASISSQLEKYGILSGAQTLSFSTSEAFSVAFEPDTFNGPPRLQYLATSADNSPLPSWVHFDPRTLTFSGLTPPLTAIPQTFGIRLIATDVEGYAGACVTFFLVVNDHRLAFQPFERSVAFTRGDRVAYSALLEELFLDGTLVKRSEIASAAATTPGWLEFDNETLTLSGERPSNVLSLNVSVTVSDIYEDTANALIHFHDDSTLFEGKLGEIDATIGQPFSYKISRTIFGNLNVSVSVDLGDASSWLHFDASTLTLHGNVPRHLHPEVVKAVITASLDSLHESQEFTIRIVKPKVSRTRHSRVSRYTVHPLKSATTAIPTAPSSPNSVAHIEHGDLSQGAKIGIGIGCAIVVLCGILIVFALRKIRFGGRSWLAKIFLAPVKSSRGRGHISRHDDEENAGDTEKTVENPNDVAPQIPVKYSRHQRETSAGSSLPSLDEAAVNSMNRTSMGTSGLTGHVPHDAMKVPSRMARQYSEDFDVSAKRLRRSGHYPRRRSGLPAESVLTGLGHGRLSSRSFNAVGLDNLRMSVFDSGSWNTIRTGSNSSTRDQIDSFSSAQRFSKNPTLESVPEDVKRSTIRRVSRSGEGMQGTKIPDRRPLEEKRQSYVRRRASTHRSNVIFGPGVGETPSERSRLAQRSHLYRSRSSSIGVRISGKSTPETVALRERDKSGLETLEDIETADRSSTYSQQQAGRDEEKRGVGGEDDDASELEILENRSLNETAGRSWGFRRSRYGRAMEVASGRPEVAEEGNMTTAGSVEMRSWSRPEMKAQRAGSLKRPVSEASSLSGSARFL